MSANRIIMCLECFEDFSDEIKQYEIRGARIQKLSRTNCGGHKASDS